MAGPRKGAAWPVCAQLSGGGRPGPGSGPRVLLASAWQTAPPEGAVVTPAWSRLGRPRPRAAHCLCLQLTPARRSRSSGRVTLLMELKSAAHGPSLTPPVMGPPPRQSSVSPLPGPPRDGWPLRGRSCPGHWLHDRPVETGLLDAPLTRPSCPPRDRPESRGMVFPRPTSVSPHRHPRGPLCLQPGRGWGPPWPCRRELGAPPPPRGRPFPRALLGGRRTGGHPVHWPSTSGTLPQGTALQWASGLAAAQDTVTSQACPPDGAGGQQQWPVPELTDPGDPLTRYGRDGRKWPCPLRGPC